MTTLNEQSHGSLVPTTFALRSFGPIVDNLLLDSIDEALTDLLGPRAREAIYDYLERNCLLARNEIPTRLGDFFRLLEGTFGRGCKTIGKVIAKRLYAKLSWEFVEIENFELADYVELVKTRLARELTSPSRKAVT